MKRPFLYCLLIFLALLASPVHHPVFAKETASQTLLADPIATLPIQIIHNRIHIKFSTGQTVLDSLLDTGATSSIFFDEQKLGNQELSFSGDAKVLFPALQKSMTGKRLKHLRLTAGSFEFISKNGLLIPQQGQSDAGYDAIIGQEIFKAYTVEVNPADRLIHLHPPGTDLTPHFTQIQRLYMEGHTPHIKFYSKMPWEERFSSKSLLLDTGYPGSMVIWNTRHYRMAMRNGSFLEKTEGSGGIVSHIRLEFGELSFENIPVFIANSVPTQSMKRDGILGASLLTQHHHVIDFARARILLRPVIGKSGKPLQIIDGRIYTPNNETFDLKSFEPKPNNIPTLIISGSADG